MDAPSTAPVIALTDFSIAIHSRAISFARKQIGRVFPGPLAFGQSQREIRPLRDLAAPHRNAELEQILAGVGDHRRFDVLAARRRGVDHHRVGLAHLAREGDGLLDRFDIEHARAARHDDQCRHAHGVGDARRHGRRGIDQHPVEAGALRGLDHIGDAARGRFQRQGLGVTQLVPQRQ